MLDYMVLYQSETGNTKKLATSIFAALPGMAKDLRGIDELSSLPMRSLEVSSVRVRCLCKSARNTNPCLMEMRSMTGI